MIVSPQPKKTNNGEQLRNPIKNGWPLDFQLRWGLDLEGLEHWAQRRQLPGVGVADLLDYRREHPEDAWVDAKREPRLIFKELENGGRGKGGKQMEPVHFQEEDLKMEIRRDGSYDGWCVFSLL